MFHKSIGISTGFGFLGIVGLVGVLTSVYVFWAFSCLGGAACELATKIV